MLRTTIALALATLLLVGGLAQAQPAPDRHHPPLPRGDELSCVYVFTPTVWEFSYPPLGRKVKICNGTVKCYYERKYYSNISTLCHLHNGDCPSAADCVRPDADFEARPSKRYVVQE